MLKPGYYVVQKPTETWMHGPYDTAALAFERLDAGIYNDLSVQQFTGTEWRDVVEHDDKD